MASALPPVPAWRRDLRDCPDLDPLARLVGHTLATFMDGAGRAQVSRSTIARGCGLTSVDPVMRAIQRLEGAGLLGVDRIKGGRHLANRYQARPNGSWTAPVEVSNGGWAATVESVQRPLAATPTVAGHGRELEGLEDQDRGGEGYGDPSAAQLARDAATAARRRLLGGE